MPPALTGMCSFGAALRTLALALPKNRWSCRTKASRMSQGTSCTGDLTPHVSIRPGDAQGAGDIGDLGRAVEPAMDATSAIPSTSPSFAVSRSRRACPWVGGGERCESASAPDQRAAHHEPGRDVPHEEGPKARSTSPTSTGANTLLVQTSSYRTAMEADNGGVRAGQCAVLRPRRLRSRRTEQLVDRYRR